MLTFLNTFVSSANVSMLLVILSSKSLIYIRNNTGPNTDHCCTPLKTNFTFIIINKSLTLNSLVCNALNYFLNPFLNNDMTFVFFHSKGTTPSFNDKLNSLVSAILICCTDV